jgi:glycosyltransferase involved in cell wall biosynthesis
MKVLLDHPSPFCLAHGGFQIQIEQTRAALEWVGVEVEPVRWWDSAQRGDLIHYFGRAPQSYIHFAQQKNIRVVLAELLTGLGSRAPQQRRLQRLLMRLAQATLPAQFIDRLAWRSFQMADACIANTPWEAQLMVEIFDAPPHKVHCIPNGVEEIFLHSAKVPRGPWLVCTATITERKRVLELAQAAVLAQTPLWVIGRPYAEGDAYARRFVELASQHKTLLRYEGPVSDRAQLARVYREARGFVLFSRMETRSLSAEEAAACECPLLLSDLPWARSVFGPHARYCPVNAAPKRAASVLREFYDAAPGLPPPPRPQTWREVGLQLKALYESLLKTS